MTATTSRTAPSTLRLSEYAKRFVFPDGITHTAWPRVEAKGRELGLGFDWWQSQLGTVCLGYGEDGRYRATVGGIGLSIPRQVGKTYFALALLTVMCILFPGLQVVWTAHHLRTSTKTFTALRGICRRKRVAPHVRSIRATNGEQEVSFVNGSKIMFGARSQGFGRGFDEIDVEVFDEAQILDTKTLEDMIAATNQARHERGALLFFMGTPPRVTDPSDAFRERRDEAWAGEAEDAVWLEIGADPDSDPNDEAQWPGMNPSYPLRTPRESMLRLRRNLKDDDSWNREGRGIWDPKAKQRGVIPLESWDAGADSLSVPVDRFALGIEVAPDATSTAISLAGQRDDDRWHVELDESMAGTAWVVPYVKGLLAANPQVRAVVLDAGSPSKVLLEAFAAEKIRVMTPRAADVAMAHTRILEGIVTGSVVHTGQLQMRAAVQVATKRSSGDSGMWFFHRAGAVSDITPIQSATLALLGAQSLKVQRPTRSTEKRKVVVL